MRKLLANMFFIIILLQIGSLNIQFDYDHTSSYIENYAIGDNNSTSVNDEDNIEFLQKTDILDDSRTSSKNILSQTQNLYFIFTFNESYPFIRSGEVVTYTIAPENPKSLLFNWDMSSNVSVLPPAPNIQSGNIEETHTLYYFAQKNDNSWEMGSKDFVIDDTAIIVTKKYPNRTKVSGFENIELNYYPSYLSRTWAFNNNPFTILNTIQFPKDSNLDPIPGQHILHVKAIDSVERVWSYDFVYFVDFTAPLINPLNFVNNSIISSGKQLYFENITPTSIFMDFYLFDFQWNSSPVFHKMPTVPSPNGLNILSVLLKDEVGNVNTATYYIYSSINFIFLPNQSYRPLETPLISFTEVPIFANYSIDYQNSSIITNMTTIPSLPSENMNVTIYINVLDSGNNWLNKSFEIKVDSYKIKFLSSTPSNNSVFDQTNINVQFIANFNESVYVIYYQFNNSLNMTSIPILPLSSSVYVLHLYFSDLAGNWDVIDLYFTRIIKLTANISQDQQINPSNIIFISSTGIFQSYSYAWDNNSYTNFPTITNNISIQMNLLSGYHYIHILTVSNGTISLFNMRFISRINVNFLDSSTNPFKSNTKINFTFSENPISWYYVWDSINNVDKYKFDSNPNVPSSDGQHILYIKAINSVGDIEFISSNAFTTDDTIPSITIDSVFNPNNSFLPANKLIKFSSKSLDIKSLYYSWNNQTADIIQLSSILIYSPDIEDQNILELFLYDYAGNYNHYLYIFFIDNIPPLISSNFVNNSFVFRDQVIKFNFSESLSPDSFYISNNNKYSIINNEITISQFNYGNYTYNITISAHDLFENNYTVLFFFSIIEPALLIEIDIQDGQLIGENIKSIEFNLSKKAKTFLVYWINEHNQYILNNSFEMKSNLIYNVKVPFSDGPFTLQWNIQTHDSVWNNKSINLVKDTLSPDITLSLSVVNENDTNLVVVNSYFSSSKITFVDANSIQNISIVDLTNFEGNISLLYSNGTTKFVNIEKSKSYLFSFITPGKTENLTLTLIVVDEAHNINQITWTLVVYDSPEFNIPFFTFEYFFVFIFIITINKKRIYNKM
jgi:hypothetical protein